MAENGIKDCRNCTHYRGGDYCPLSGSFYPSTGCEDWSFKKPVHSTDLQSSVVGGAKHDEGKLRYDLIPAHALVDVVWAFTFGAEKYGERNWEKGMKWSRLYASLMRHLQEWWLGGDNDPDDALPFMAKVTGAALMLTEYAHTHPELDDRPKIGGAA